MTARPPTAAPDPAALFAALRASFALAERQAGATERHFAPAGQRVALRIAGPGLAGLLTDALRHLEIPRGPANLTVLAWDGAASGAPLPPSPWRTGDVVERGEVAGFNTDRFRTVYLVDADILCMFDQVERTALYWIRDARHMPQYEQAAPLRPLLNWHLPAGGAQLVHAAAVGRPNGGLLIAGPSGTGKSSTALTCLLAGLGYAADDYCAVTVAPRPEVHSLYNTAKVNADNLARFPELAARVHSRSQHGPDKAMLFVHQHFPDRMLTRFPLRAILIPRLTGGRETRITPLRGAQVLTGLAPSTLLQLPGAGADSFHTLARLVGQVPGYALELGTERDLIPAVLDRLLESR